VHTQLVKEALSKLGIEFNDENENLFDLGLDSLLLVRLVISLERVFSLKLVKNFDRANFSTAKNIAKHISSVQGDQQEVA